MSNMDPTIIKIIIHLSVLHSYKFQELRPTVSLNQGVVVGVKVYLSRATINAFLGIPYAEPPVGELRFSVPKKHNGWTGTRFAGSYAPLCPYFLSNNAMSDKEDCLYLNIWTSVVRILFYLFTINFYVPKLGTVL